MMSFDVFTVLFAATCPDVETGMSPRDVLNVELLARGGPGIYGSCILQVGFRHVMLDADIVHVKVIIGKDELEDGEIAERMVRGW
jgi:hypothetical protein